MTLAEIPRAPILLAAKPSGFKRGALRFGIPSLADRRYHYQRWGGYSGRWLEADWSDVRPDGDLLYVGSSASALATRLHPRSHVMWSVVSEPFARKDVRIAIWALPHDHDSVERWLTQTCAPLWSNAGTTDHEYRWRDPDLILPIDTFHPHERSSDRAPFGMKTGGVYAWLTGNGAVSDILLGGAEERRARCAEIAARPPRRFWRCPAHKWPEINEGVPSATSVCHACGLTYEAARAESDDELRAAISRAFDEEPPAIQERVGHKALETTFGYMKTTKAARDAVARAFDEED